MTGHFIDKNNSNFYTKNAQGQFLFKYNNVVPLAGNFIPNLLGLVCMALMLMYAG